MTLAASNSLVLGCLLWYLYKHTNLQYHFIDLNKITGIQDCPGMQVCLRHPISALFYFYCDLSEPFNHIALHFNTKILFLGHQ